MSEVPIILHETKTTVELDMKHRLVLIRSHVGEQPVKPISGNNGWHR